MWAKSSGWRGESVSDIKKRAIPVKERRKKKARGGEPFQDFLLVGFRLFGVELADLVTDLFKKEDIVGLLDGLGSRGGFGRLFFDAGFSALGSLLFLRGLAKPLFKSETSRLEGGEDLDDDEEGQGDDEEGDDRIDEASPVDDGSAVVVVGSAVLRVHVCDRRGEIALLREVSPFRGSVALLQCGSVDEDVGGDLLGGIGGREDSD